MVRFGILGMAKSGIAAAYKIKELGGKPFLSEFLPKEKIANWQNIVRDFKCEFGGHSDKILNCDTIIVSPGIPLNIPILQKAKKQDINIIGEIEFGFSIKSSDSKIIAVTGSNGKSTTVSLIHHTLLKTGYNSILAGNIGTPFTAFPIEKSGIDFIVLELSSFQLETIKKFKADVAVLLNITPDHLNRYENMDEYAKTKFRIFENQNEDDLAILNFDDKFVQKYKNLIFADKKYFSSKVKKNIVLQNNFLHFSSKNISLKNAILKGPHNIENMMATILALENFNVSKNIFETALQTFSPLAHRLEFVQNIDGISFYNDSKATNTDSVKYALQSFDKPIRLIIGGAGKNEDYTVLNQLIKKYVTKLYIIGNDRFKMKKTFEKNFNSQPIVAAALETIRKEKFDQRSIIEQHLKIINQ